MRWAEGAVMRMVAGTEMMAARMVLKAEMMVTMVAAAAAAAAATAAEAEAAAAAARAAARAAALAAVRRLGGPRLRLVAVGGAVVPQAQLAFLREVFGGAGCAVSNGSGMSGVAVPTADG